MIRNIFVSAFVAILVSAGTFIGLQSMSDKNERAHVEQQVASEESTNSSPRAIYTLDENGNTVPLSFEKVAARAMDAVVGIQSKVKVNHPRYGNDPFEEFRRYFGIPDQPRRNNNSEQAMGSGSGVIISKDGYIVTNNHVVDKATSLTVTLHDNREYQATIIGTDPSTDLALIKIDGKDLTTLPLVNSDEVRVGEWVLAVGNPFHLSSTVTAGIVSAKARNINILDEKYAVESFIQTDAAINKGNSGGALINMNGGLIGINSAIFSPSGAYSGYGFAIPSNLVSKIVKDLKEYGTVQRGFLGVSIRNVDYKIAQEADLEKVQGVYIAEVLEDGAASDANIEKGSVILEVNGHEISSTPELMEKIARKRPGDEIELTIIKDGKKSKRKVVLRNNKGNTDIVSRVMQGEELMKKLGIQVKEVDSALASKLEISGGVQITDISPESPLTKYSKIENGFIVTKIDGRDVYHKEDFMKLLSKYENVVMIEGVYPDRPGVYYYSIGLNI